MQRDMDGQVATVVERNVVEIVGVVGKGNQIIENNYGDGPR